MRAAATRSVLRARADAFCRSYGLRAPILLAPMAGACPPALSIAVAQAGGMGPNGCVSLEPAAIGDWVDAVRTGTEGPFQLDLWIPDPPPVRDAGAEARVRAFLSRWGPAVPDDAIVAQGLEAGGHRGAFDAASAEATGAGLLALVPAIVDAVDVPVIAAGGIADARGRGAGRGRGADAGLGGAGRRAGACRFGRGDRGGTRRSHPRVSRGLRVCASLRCGSRLQRRPAPTEADRG
jgi:nitronate monooxygenase